MLWRPASALSRWRSGLIFFPFFFFCILDLRSVFLVFFLLDLRSVFIVLGLQQQVPPGLADRSVSDCFVWVGGCTWVWSGIMVGGGSGIIRSLGGYFLCGTIWGVVLVISSSWCVGQANFNDRFSSLPANNFSFFFTLATFEHSRLTCIYQFILFPPFLTSPPPPPPPFFPPLDVLNTSSRISPSS